MINVSPDEYILVSSWEALASEIGGNLVFRHTDAVPELFERVRGTGRRVILLTAGDDYGVHLQAEHHPNVDLFKMATATNWNDIASRKGVYVELNLTAAQQGCNPQHRYSVKTERYTFNTFNSVPDEVVGWYAANLNCECPPATLIPFGLNDHGEGSCMIPGFTHLEKKRLFYVNFQNNSLERVQLKKLFECCPWATFRPEANLPVRQFLAEMSEHKFIFSPPGNGVDCYRIWEALYLGCIPVLLDSHFARTLYSWRLPVLVVRDPSLLREDFLERIWSTVQDDPRRFDYRKARMSYWRERLREEAWRA